MENYFELFDTVEIEIPHKKNCIAMQISYTTLYIVNKLQLNNNWNE